MEKGHKNCTDIHRQLGKELKQKLDKSVTLCSTVLRWRKMREKVLAFYYNHLINVNHFTYYLYNFKREFIHLVAK